MKKDSLKANFPVSLSRKLAILYALTTFGTLLLASGLLYWSLLGHLEREHQNLLMAKIDEIRHYFQAWPKVNVSLHELIGSEHHHSSLSHSSSIHPRTPHHAYIRILNAQGSLLAESTPIPSFAAELEFPAPGSFNAEAIQIVKFQSQTTHQYLLGTTWTNFNDENQTKRIIQAALELTPDETLLTEYQHTLAGVLIIGVLLSAFGGYFIARRGLAPLHKITETIQRINVQQLNERVDAQQWPKELALLANAFDEMLARLDRSFAQLSQFSADLAHELRTPVNNIMGETEVALTRQRDPEEYRQTLESCLEECSRIARMIDELLFLARAENQQTAIISCQMLSVETEFKKIVEFYENVAAEKQVSLTYQANQTMIFADANLLRRIFNNLLSNALRYTPPHGIINLSAKSTANGSCKITVTDSGEGIPEHQLPYIFDRFFQVDKARHHDNQSSGLGLAIVKSIIELHRGSITVYNQKAKGLTVEMIFPASP